MQNNNYFAQFTYRDDAFHASDSPTNIPSLTPASTLGSSLDASPSRHTAGDDVLDGTLFPEFQNDEDKDLEEHQKEDPLGIDMWKFYRKQTRLPDSGRMENMTWRMMAINLRKAQHQNKKSSSKRAQQTHNPSTVSSTQTSVAAAGQYPGRIAHPSASDGLHPLFTASSSSSFSSSSSDRPNTHNFQLPDDYQYGYTPDATPQIHPSATTFQRPPPPGYDFRNGPRGHIQVPPIPSKPESQGSAPMHSRHVSLATEYLDPSSFGEAPGTLGFQTAFNQRGYGDVVPWDPGWAEEAFGGQALYGSTPRQQQQQQQIKREEVEETMGGPQSEDWLFAGGSRGIVDGPYAGSLSGQVGGSQQQGFPSMTEWQRSEESHYAEVLDQKPRFGMHQPGQYGQGFARQGFDFGGSVPAGGQVAAQPQHAGVWEQGSSFVVAGRKRRKGQ